MVELEVSFETAAEAWLVAAQKRKRKPMWASSVPTIRCALDKYLLPALGELPLARVHNGTVKHAVAAMQEANLSPKTINTYTNIVKTVVASVINEETGEPVYMRKWNAQVLDLPVIENQRQPVFSPEEIEKIVGALPTHGWEQMLYVLLAATGLRISEALALQRRNIVNLHRADWRTLDIVQQVGRFGGIVDYTKTKAGVRQVDLHPDVANLLKVYLIRGRKQGSKGDLIFPTRTGEPLLPRNVLRNLTEHTDKGFHAFRRFRETWLSEQSCNSDVKIFWMGHKPETMSELYSKLAKKPEMRLKEAERVGVGFDRPKVSQIVKVA